MWITVFSEGRGVGGLRGVLEPHCSSSPWRIWHERAKDRNTVKTTDDHLEKAELIAWVDNETGYWMPLIS